MTTLHSKVVIVNLNKLPEFDLLEELTGFFDDNNMGNYWQAMPEVD